MQKYVLRISLEKKGPMGDETGDSDVTTKELILQRLLRQIAGHSMGLIKSLGEPFHQERTKTESEEVEIEIIC